MLAVNRSLIVRARLEAGSEPPFDRLYDPLVHEVVTGGPLVRDRFATLWSDTAALVALAESKRAPLAAPLAQAMRDYHQRLGAPPQSLAALERLARGEVVCSVTGQQPAPLGGPLYALHKTASAIGLARVFEERTGLGCVPLYWMHGEDSDFEEIHSTTVFDGQLAIHDLAIPASFHRDGGLVGSIPAEALVSLQQAAVQCWAGMPGQADAAALLNGALERARDLGEACSALALALFGAFGLVVVDPRLPEFRAAARPILDRYLDHAADLTRVARAAGEELERRLTRRPLTDASLESFVFAIEDGTRTKIGAAEARARGVGVTLSPSVALRPAVQDGVFPTVAMACGAGEISYLAQLREVFEGVGVRPAAVVPRFAATWLPAEAVALIEAAGVHPWELITGADAVLKRHAERTVPQDMRRALDDARSGTNAALRGFAEAAQRLDASLPQMVESARGKIDFQFARLDEGLVGKARHQLERRHPAWVRIRYVLMPGEKLQERRIASLQPLAQGGMVMLAELCDLATEHARAVAGGRHEHFVLELPA